MWFLLFCVHCIAQTCELTREEGKECSSSSGKEAEYAEFSQLPVIDISSLLQSGSPLSDKQKVAQEIGKACRDVGFFYILNHGVSEELQDRLLQQSQEFFALPEEEKLLINMKVGGSAWRGFFPVGGELTSGRPDIKEGIYFGEELPSSHPLVAGGVPLHGANIFPTRPVGFRETVLEYLDAMVKLGEVLMRGISLSLDKDENFFHDHFMKDPLILFRIFNYPPPAKLHFSPDSWGVGEHTDYGLLTILKQDDSGGLQVRNRDNVWVQAPPLENSFVINIGDMIEKMTNGLYRSTPHRVDNPSPNPRLSFPFFFDPDWAAEMREIELSARHASILETMRERGRLKVLGTERWDQTNVLDVEGTYGDYVLGKVLKVFPELGKEAVFGGY